MKLLDVWLFLFTAHKRSLGQGNVFTRVCHSVHRESQSLSRVLRPEGGLCPGGLCPGGPGGVSVCGGPCQETPIR